MKKTQTVRPAVVVIAMLLFTASGCESTNEESIDGWMRTQKGPSKLLDTLKDPDATAPLRARAASNLIRIDQSQSALESLRALPEADRKAVVAALVPQLWDVAKISERLRAPSDAQIRAKDALFNVRGLGDVAAKAAVDAYLVEWLSGYYEERAKVGLVQGSSIVLSVGESAGEGLLESANSILAAPPDADGRRLRMGDGLLYALSLTGAPPAANFVVGLVGQDKRDETLPARAIAALHRAYVVGEDGTTPDGRALKTHIDKFESIGFDEGNPGKMRNDAFGLVAAAGMPECLPVFLNMISADSQAEAFRWMGVQQAIRCGGPSVALQVGDAVPDSGSYERGILERYFWEEIVKAGSKKEVAVAAVTMLASKSWVTRISGAEMLLMVRDGMDASELASKVENLESDRSTLRGYDGGKKGKGPTLGARAKEISSELRKR